MKIYKVWSGRYSKLVVAKNTQDAIRKSGYKDVDQVDALEVKKKGRLKK